MKAATTVKSEERKRTSHFTLSLRRAYLTPCSVDSISLPEWSVYQETHALRLSLTLLGSLVLSVELAVQKHGSRQMHLPASDREFIEMEATH